MAATLAQILKTRCVNGHDYSPENTRVDNRGWRRCRACEANWDRTRRRQPSRDRREYHALRYQEQKRGTWQYRTTIKRRRRIGEEILDLLLIEGGWWTIDGITVRLGFNPKSISRTLIRLRHKGQVRSRRIGLATGRNRMGLESRQEWKALPLTVGLV